MIINLKMKLDKNKKKIKKYKKSGTFPEGKGYYIQIAKKEAVN